MGKKTYSFLSQSAALKFVEKLLQRRMLFSVKPAYILNVERDTYDILYIVDTDELSRKYRKKTELPDKSTFEHWMKEGKSRTEIKKMLAARYGVSPKTIQRKMADYGLTRNYKSNKSYKPSGNFSDFPPKISE